MKKQLIIAAACGLALLAGGCSGGNQAAAPAQKTVSEVKDESNFETPFALMAGDYDCVTEEHDEFILKIESDRSFAGEKSRMYYTSFGPVLSVKELSDFKGEFSELSQADNYTYTTGILRFDYQMEPGSTQTVGNTRYDFVEAKHLGKNDGFMVYKPGTPLSRLPQECVTWLIWRTYVEYDDVTLRDYVLYDTVTRSVFMKKPKETPKESAADYTVSPAFADDPIRSGIWLEYSTQSFMATAYEFRDKTVTVTDISLWDNSATIVKTDRNPRVLPYQIEKNEVVVDFEDGQKHFVFTDNPNQMKYSFYPTDTSTNLVTLGLYRHDTMPSYDEMQAESRKDRDYTPNVVQ